VRSRLTHDWNDEDAVRIHTNCHRVLGEDGTLHIVEAVHPERARDVPAAIRLDLSMLMLMDGREPIAPDFAQLLANAGFTMTKIVQRSRASVAAGPSVVEVTKTT
jgi:O-methyltransferase domain